MSSHGTAFDLLALKVGKIMLYLKIGFNWKYFMRNPFRFWAKDQKYSKLNEFILSSKRCHQCLFKVLSNVPNVLSFVTVAVLAHLLQDTVNKNLKLTRECSLKIGRILIPEKISFNLFNWTWECSACKFRWTSQPVYTKHSSAPTRQIIKCLGEDIPCPIDTFEKEENNECEACSDRCTKEKEMFNFPKIFLISK